MGLSIWAASTDACHEQGVFLQRAGDFDPDVDSVLLLGDPVACARFVHCLSNRLRVDRFTALKWDRRAGRYVPAAVG